MNLINKSSVAALLAGAVLMLAAPANAGEAIAKKRAPAFEVVSQADLKLTRVVDYGHSLNDLLSGKVAPPPQGARVDISFAGKSTGILSGTMTGIDYANIRADGRFELNIFAEIVTKDGARISYEAKGVSVPQTDGTGKLREAVRLTTGSKKYAWVNGRTFIAEGTVNPATGAVNLTLLK